MRDYPDLLILRHGQTTWNAAGKFQGQMNSPLTELGREQAQSQHDILQRVDPDHSYDLYCSPLGRTRETAEIALAGRAQPVQFDARLAEIAVGVAEGLTMLDLEECYPEVVSRTSRIEWCFRCPKGETFEDICTRLRDWLDDLTAPAIVVTHGIASRVLRGLVLGLDMDGMEQLPGGQGVVYFVKDGVHHKLEA